MWSALPFKRDAGHRKANRGQQQVEQAIWPLLGDLSPVMCDVQQDPGADHICRTDALAAAEGLRQPRRPRPPLDSSINIETQSGNGGGQPSKQVGLRTRVCAAPLRYFRDISSFVSS